MRCQFAAKPGKIESSIDLPHQMIFGNRLAKMKLVEQLTLVTLQTAHHGSTSPRFASTQRNHGWSPVSTDFCNKICHQRTLSLPRSRTAFFLAGPCAASACSRKAYTTRMRSEPLAHTTPMRLAKEAAPGSGSLASDKPSGHGGAQSGTIDTPSPRSTI